MALTAWELFVWLIMLSLEEMFKGDPAGQINSFETAQMMAVVPEK